MTTLKLPISKPHLDSTEVSAACEALLSGWVSQGPRVSALEVACAQYLSSRCACAVSSGTAALHLALIAVGVKPGNVVVTVSHSFIATANAVRHCGAEPVFVDIETNTLNMSAQKLASFLADECMRGEGDALYLRGVERFLGKESPLKYIREEYLGRVAAIMPVHQLGMPCDISRIVEIGRSYGIPVVEDAACALGSEVFSDERNVWEKIGRPHGDIACFSFHPRKVITTGEGGVITTDNLELDDTVRALRQHGMIVPAGRRYRSLSTVKEQYVATGFNHRMSDILAAVGVEQLKKVPRMVATRKTIAAWYSKFLSDIPWVALPREPRWARSNCQSFAIMLSRSAPVTRDELIATMRENGVACKPGIMNAHAERPYSDVAYDLRYSEAARSATVLLPMYDMLTEKDIIHIRGCFPE